MSILIARDVVREPLYAVVPYQNSPRWKSRVKHTERALKHFHDSGATIIFVELAYNRREFEFENIGIDGVSTNCGSILGQDSRFKHKHIKLRTMSELWLKENMINAGVARLPYDWEQVCWLDSDVHFLRPNWVGEAIHKLQHTLQSGCAFLQMFSHARDLGPNYEMLPEDYPKADGLGFIHAWRQGLLKKGKMPKCACPPGFKCQCVKKGKCAGCGSKEDCECVCVPQYPYPARTWPGLAWACTRKAWDAVGGLWDGALWGGGDYDMSYALIEEPSKVHLNGHPNYNTMLSEWQDRCRLHIRKNVLVMEGTITHHWHGKKENRQYAEKNRLMHKVQFDPLRHIKRDYQGLYQLHDDGSDTFVHFRDTMRAISKSRKEDANEI